jgi:hypothetical protein
MRQLAAIGLILATFIVGTGTLAAAQTAPAKKAIDVYKEYQAAVKTAKTLATVLPFLTKQYQTNLQGAPKDMQDRMFKRMQEDGSWKDIVVTKETIKTDTCELEATSTGPDGKPMTGKIAFKNEGGAWKIEGQGWVHDFGKKE